MAQCPNCGATVGQGDAACHACGARLGQPGQQHGQQQHSQHPQGRQQPGQSHHPQQHQQPGQSGQPGGPESPRQPGQPQRRPPDADKDTTIGGLTRRQALAAGGLGAVVIGGGVLLLQEDESTLNPMELGSSVADAPNADFDFSYAGTATQAGDLTITHVGGDFIASTQLFVRGTDLPQTGSWAALGGDATGETESGDPAVVAGDSLVLQRVTPTYEVEVVWEPADPDRGASTLAEHTGPGA